MLNQKILDHLYTNMGWSDKEIGIFFGVDRTAVVHLRKKHCIKTRKSTGEIGEEFVIKQLENLGHQVLNLNSKDKTAPYDLLVDGQIRIDVKTAKELNNRFTFSLTDREKVTCIESDHRIRLANKRTKKLFRKTCDYLVLVGMRGDEIVSFIVPSVDLPDSLQNITILTNPASNNKYMIYKDLLKKKPSCANN